MTIEPEAHIIIGPDGTILGTHGALPEGLLDRRIDECSELPTQVRDAAHTLLGALLQSRARMVTRSIDSADGRLQLIALAALPIRRAAVDVRALLLSKLGVIASQAQDLRITLTVETADTVPPVLEVDPDKVAWAVTTLVGNALRYMQWGSRRHPGGTVDVRTSFDVTDSQLTITVHDDGPGVPPETVARLFKRDGGLNVRGAGLSLLLIADVCAAHGGNVDVRSSTGASDHGTTIRMTFATR